jgi:hypothetical protein
LTPDPEGFRNQHIAGFFRRVHTSVHTRGPRPERSAGLGALVLATGTIRYPAPEDAESITSGE